jgi:energy-coupling factor transport system permease protein
VTISQGVRRWAGTATAVGILILLAGIYGVLVAGSLPGGGIPFVAVGAALLAAGLVTSGRRTNRTRYRPDLWRTPEWMVSVSGAVVVGSLVAAALVGEQGLESSVYPLTSPTLPLLAVVGILVGLVPAWAAPDPTTVVTLPNGARPEPVAEPECVTSGVPHLMAPVVLPRGTVP